MILATACVSGFLFLRDSTYNRAYKEAQAQYAAAEADRQLYEDCMALGAAEKVLACLKDKVKPGRETQRAEDDLQAQKDMADATWGMLVISAVIGFSSMGVAVWVGLLVRDTLNETRAIGYNQLRAYVTISNVSGNISYEGHIPKFDIQITFRNGGQTPAKDIYQSCRIWTDPHTPSRLRDNSIGATGTWLSMDIGPSDIGTLEISGHTFGEWPPKEGGHLLLVGSIGYVDYTGKEWEEDFRVKSKRIFARYNILNPGERTPIEFRQPERLTADKRQRKKRQSS